MIEAEGTRALEEAIVGSTSGTESKPIAAEPAGHPMRRTALRIKVGDSEELCPKHFVQRVDT